MNRKNANGENNLNNSDLHCLKNLYIYGTTLIIAEGNVP